MRRTTLHRTTLATAATATALLLAGCGTSQDGKGGGGSPGTTAPASSPSSPAATAPTNPTTPTNPTASASGGSTAPSAPASPPVSASAPPPPGCTGHADLTAADSGRTVCLTVGGYLRLTLDGTKDRPWAPVKVTGSSVLKGADAGIVILPGDALAAYTATAPGTARLTSSRPMCAASPGTVACQGIARWTVTVRVTRP
ncbi:hypothetical protein ACFPC0_11475 [Streptomyces andamanensis]|uniref:DUF4232 domain-containing protein n=1 Tax=Streptomyces andamanensis TaxID=1565035 RepID=A0ABV8TCS2_9ACTN